MLERQYQKSERCETNKKKTLSRPTSLHNVQLNDLARRNANLSNLTVLKICSCC